MVGPADAGADAEVVGVAGDDVLGFTVPDVDGVEVVGACGPLKSVHDSLRSVSLPRLTVSAVELTV